MTEHSNSISPSILSGYVRVDQLAAELGVSEWTLGKWHRLNVGPPRVKVGRRIFYSVAGIRAWMKAQEEATGTAVLSGGAQD